MIYTMTKSYPSSKSGLPMLDGRLYDDEEMQIEIQTRGNNKMVYIHINGITITRILAKNVSIVKDT